MAWKDIDPDHRSAIVTGVMLATVIPSVASFVLGLLLGLWWG